MIIISIDVGVKELCALYNGKAAHVLIPLLSNWMCRLIVVVVMAIVLMLRIDGGISKLV